MRPLTLRGSASSPPRASRWEILGAWLGVWTPPRGVQVPPRPSARRLAAAGGAAAVVAGAALAVAVPRIDDAKDDRAARTAAAQAAAAAATRADAVRIQRASFATSAAQALPAQLDDARRAILADARDRHAGGELGSAPDAVTCSRAAGRARGDLVRFSCVAVTSPVAGVPSGERRNLGYPFSLVLQPDSGRFAWCRTLPVPAEGATGGGVRVPQPAVCRGGVTPAP